MANLMPTETAELFTSFRFFPAERQVFEKNENLTISEWAEKYRIVTKSSKPGPWKNENNPALKGMMDLMEYARKIFVEVKSVQSGGTEAAHNYIYKKMDTSSHNALLVMENERKTMRTIKQRIRPAISAMPRIAEKLSSNPDDTTNYSITLRTNFNLNIGWSNSQSALASDPYETVVLDEIDKYDKAINIEEAKDRVTTYVENGTGKILILSTPGHEHGPIMQEYKTCEAHYDFFAVCPKCHQEQHMNFQMFWWPDKDKAFKDDRERHKTANIIERDKTARYKCEHCEALWTDYQRDQALILGAWKSREELNKRPVSIGVKFPSWLSPFKSLSTIAARWLRAQGNIAKLQKWYNNESAEPFSEELTGKSIKEDVLYARRHPYGPEDATWQVPMPGCVLTCFVDVQANRLDLETVAWGKDYESWGVEYQQLYGDPDHPELWQSLDAYLRKEFLHESANKMQINICGIDEGFKSTAVREFVAKRKRVFNCKGSSHDAKQLITLNRSRQPKLTRMGKIYIQPIIIGTNEAKKTLFSWMEITEPGPGFMHWHEGYSYDYFKMLTAERMDTQYKRGGFPSIIFKPKFEGIRNEALDIRVGNYAMIKLLNPDFKKLAEGLQAQKQDAPVAARKTGRRIISQGIE